MPSHGVGIEKHYYESLHYSIYTPTDAPGRAQRIDNVEVSRTSRAYPANCSADIPYTYSDVLPSTTVDRRDSGAGISGVLEALGVNANEVRRSAALPDCHGSVKA